MKRVSIAVAVAAIIFSAPFAEATTKKDIEILGRALGFVEGSLPNNVSVSVIHNPSIPESKAHADELMDLMGSGLAAGKITFTSKLVDASNLGSLSGSQVAFSTKGLGATEASAFTAASGGGVIVVGELACVDAGNCVISVTSTPSVKIYVSKAAAAQSSVSFADAFRMMITEK
jgi:hypothetical protein